MIGVEGAQTPAGAAGQMRPRRSKATRRLSASPAENEAPGTEINRAVNRASFIISVFNRKQRRSENTGMTEKAVVLDQQGIRRALTRIAHEIKELKIAYW